MHASNYGRSDSVELVAAADLSETALNRFAEHHAGVKTYLSSEEMLANEKPDIVSVCTPPAFHNAPALSVARAGCKGLLLEKPMALTLPDADAIINECSRSGVTLAVGHQLRCSPPAATARRLIEAGAIGALERVWGVCHNAPVQTNATHTIDLMRFLAGDKSAIWVMGSMERGEGTLREGIPSEDAAVGLFQFQDGPVALIEAGALKPYRGYHHITVDGSDGQIELSRPDGPALRIRSSATGWSWETPHLVDDLNPVDDLVAAIRNGGEPRSSGSQARATLELILALFESARTLRRIDLPLAIDFNPLDRVYEHPTNG